jgi:hypothetical protein
MDTYTEGNGGHIPTGNEILGSVKFGGGILIR